MKLKIEHEDKLDLVVAGKVFKKGALYRVLIGDDAGHAYYLKKIYKVDRDWMLKLGEHDYDAEIRCTELEETDFRLYRACGCNFLCEGYVLKG